MIKEDIVTFYPQVSEFCLQGWEKLSGRGREIASHWKGYRGEVEKDKASTNR